jgi:hypothetical protein
MSFGDKAILWLHLAAAIFTIGPGTAAIMSTPRYIRNRNPVVVGFLFRTTRIYSLGSLLVLVFGLILTGMTHKFSQWWISVSRADRRRDRAPGGRRRRARPYRLTRRRHFADLAGDPGPHGLALASAGNGC